MEDDISMESVILNSLKLRQGMPDEDVLKDMISDCVDELKDYLNYLPEDTLPQGVKGIVKELVLIKVNTDGVQGLKSESKEGTSSSYIEDVPKALKRRIFSKRKLPRCNSVN